MVGFGLIKEWYEGEWVWWVFVWLLRFFILIVGLVSGGKFYSGGFEDVCFVYVVGVVREVILVGVLMCVFECLRWS